HALVDEELEKGLRALAVPLRDGAGRTVAALNVSTYTGRGSREESRARLLPALAETAADIGDELRIAFERRPLRPGGPPAPAPTPARSRGREGISAAAPRRRP
ncbi:IclR family transcriptional regulator C-terminal domain-containing protein, partial [Streptomyces sp. NPDC048845]|uniref:IclR family transcriptional regulator domain-containing protein n=1 Tax=Streptomyces sp. NPDC048845 TaxID=3155390 RepID=UPI00343F3895